MLSTPTSRLARRLRFERKQANVRQRQSNRSGKTSIWMKVYGVLDAVQMIYFFFRLCF